MFGFKLSEVPRPKSRLGQRRTVHVGFPCSAPSTNPTTSDASVPPCLDPQLSPTVKALHDRNFFFLSRPLVTFLWRTKWRLSRPSRVWRDHLQFSAFRFVTLSMDACFSPIPSKTKQSQLSFNWDGDPGPLPQNKLERPDNARFAFFTLPSVYTRVSTAPLCNSATRPHVGHRDLPPSIATSQ